MMLDGNEIVYSEDLSIIYSGYNFSGDAVSVHYANILSSIASTLKNMCWYGGLKLISLGTTSTAVKARLSRNDAMYDFCAELKSSYILVTVTSYGKDRQLFAVQQFVIYGPLAADDLFGFILLTTPTKEFLDEHSTAPGR